MMYEPYEIFPTTGFEYENPKGFAQEFKKPNEYPLYWVCVRK